MQNVEIGPGAVPVFLRNPPLPMPFNPTTYTKRNLLDSTETPWFIPRFGNPQ
jgi:hypothetical protein